MAHMTPWVHQYTLRDLLDDSFDLFKQRVVTLLLAAVFPFLLVVLYMVVMRLFVFPGSFALDFPSLLADLFSAGAGSGHAFDDLVHSVGFRDFMLFSFGLWLVSMVAFVIAYIAQCRVATWHTLGRTFTVAQTFRLLAKPFFSLLVVGFVYSLMLGIASSVTSVVASIIGLIGMAVGEVFGSILMALVFFLVYVLTVAMISAFFLASPISLAVDHTGPFTAIGKGFQAASANFKAHFYGFALIMHVPMIFSALIYLVAMLLQNVATQISPMVTLTLGTVIGGLGNMVLIGFVACFQTLVYLDGRCRKENYDLQLLARDMDMGEEVERLFAGDAPSTALAGYPDYAATPQYAGVATAMVTPDLPASGAAPAFPDYSAPPPPADAVETQGGDDAH